jgi:hypothetical protein
MNVSLINGNREVRDIMIGRNADHDKELDKQADLEPILSPQVACCQ